MFRSALIVAVIAVLPSFISGARAQGHPSILLNGTWALDFNRDPFLRSFPATTYLPAGTILFKIEKAPVGAQYVSALTQNGFWIQIAKPAIGGPRIRPLSSFSVSLPSDTLFMHQSILCLSQTNRIVEPNERCETGEVRTPVGEGWIFTFTDSKKPGWVILTTTLNAETKRELEARGWDPSETEFEVKKDDLHRLESMGRITLLNRTYPVVSFKNRIAKPVLIECGTKTVTAQKLRAAVSAEVSAEAKVSFLQWLGLKLGITVDSSAEASKEYSLEIDTTKSSYLYYYVPMYDYVSKVESSIKIEKEFECVSGPRHDFGDKITKISVEIDSPRSPDPVSYEFDDPKVYETLIKDGDNKDIYDFSTRPLFVSLNTPSSYTRAVTKLMTSTGIEDRRLAEFIMANMNYSCPYKTRVKCAKLAY